MSERCEPPPEWRHMRWHMLEADVEPLGWCPPKTAVWQAPAAWMGGTLGWSNDFGLGFDGPEEAAEKGWRYIAPVTPPATVAALVEALVAFSVAIPAVLDAADIDASDTVFTVRAVLPTGSRKLAQRSLADMLEAARAALALYREAGR